MAKRIASNDEERKRQIMDAGLKCMLQFGYAKTSLDDVAKAAGLSRPLIYLKFKNKEDLFRAVYEYLLDQPARQAEAILKKPLSQKAKLGAICEALLLGPWDKITGYTMTSEFYNSCEELFPNESARYSKLIFKFVMEVLGDKDVSEVFLMALEGLHADIPPTKILKKRIAILVERFDSSN